jgi:hypothetical protein
VAFLFYVWQVDKKNAPGGRAQSKKEEENELKSNLPYAFFNRVVPN